MRFWCSAMFVLAAGAAQAACPGQNQLEMNDCAAARYAQADAQLNAVWPGVKGYMDSLGAGAALLDAQRKWLAYRDATCTSEITPYAGGSIRPLIWYTCLERVTRVRTDELQGLMNP
ncbi:MAG: lysozyme inhibitor LprI family protein [Pseudomonadota bacterium]